MKPLVLRARNYRSFGDLEFNFQDGATAVTGSNGTGKSSLIGAVEVALFGPRGRSLEPLVREGTDDMQLCLEFEHGGETYRVRRGWVRAKSTLDLERETIDYDGPDLYFPEPRPAWWDSLSQGTAADTQAHLESIIGMSRSTFLASGYLAQRESDSFTGAQPRDRKRLLADALALDAWEDSRNEVAIDRRQAEKELAAVEYRITAAAERAAQADALAAEAVDLRAAILQAETEQRTAETEASAHAQTAADLDEAEKEWAIRQAAVTVAEQAAQHHLAAAAARHQALADEHRAATARRDDLAARGRTAFSQAQDMYAKAQLTVALIGESQLCDTCGQHLGEEAAHTAAATYRTRSQELISESQALAEQAAAIEIPTVPDATDTTDTDDYRSLYADVTAAEQTLAEIAQPQPGAAAVARIEADRAGVRALDHSRQARAAAERLAAVTALLEQAQAAQAELSAAEVERGRLNTDLDILTRLEQAFGRDGVPAWIVESQALPHIETEANRVLSLLGGAITRVELRTERATKSGKVNEALDVICFTEDGERALETFSGSEQTRCEIALALGLAAVLLARRDADLNFLALDEPEGLDDDGSAALASMLQEMARDRVVMLVSHNPNLRDQFDASITIERDTSGSVVTA